MKLTSWTLLFILALLGGHNAWALWSTQTVDAQGIMGGYISMALDSSNRPHIAYKDATNGDVEWVKYAEWTGSTWTMVAIDTGNTGADMSLVIDTIGRLHVSYFDFNSGGAGFNLKYASSTTGLVWSTSTVDSKGLVGADTFIDLDSSNNPHISYYDTSNGDLKYAKWTGTAWSTQTVDSAGDVGEHSALALDSSNNAHISYFGQTNGDLKYAKWDGSAWTIATVDIASYTGQHIARTWIALDNSNNPHISYPDLNTNTQDLKYAKWTGAAWSTQTVDSTNNVGQQNSLILDSSWNPRIAYFDESARALKYAKWAGSAWVLETVDNPQSVTVGQYPVIDLDSGDNPHIAYMDSTNYDLKYAQWVSSPAAPSATTVSTRSATSLGWQWTDNSWNETNFKVLRSSNAENLSGNLSANTTSWMEAGLSTNTFYERKVVSYNEAGASTSGAVGFYTLAEPATGFSIVAVATQSIEVSWGANTNPSTTIFRLTYWTVAGSTSTASVTTTTASVSGLASATTYYLQVYAVNGDGLSSSSSTVISTMTTGMVSAPQGFSGAALGVSSISWSWSDVSNELGYRVLSSSGGDISGALSSGATTWVEVNLSTNTSYSRLAVAFNESGASTSSAVAVYALSAPPTGFTLVQVGYSSVTMQWGANTNSSSTLYQISYWEIGGSTVSVSTAVTAFAASGLAGGVTHYFELYALNGDSVTTRAVDSALSTVTAVAPLSTPSGFTATALGISSITWSWVDISDETGYRVISSSGGNISGDLAANTTSWTALNLSTNTSYTRKLTAYNANDSATTSALTKYTLAAVPSDLVFSSVFFSSVTMAWSASGNPLIVTSYYVSRWIQDGSTVTSNGVFPSSAPTNLSAATTYYFSVYAVNGNGVASSSAAFVSTVTLAAPRAPQGISAAALGVTSMTWSWIDVADESGYRVISSTGGNLSGVLNPGVTTWIETSLSTNTNYSRAVEAFNMVAAATSSVVNAYTLVAPATGFETVSVSSYSISVQWGANTNPSTTTYRVSYWTVSGSTAAVSATVTTATVTGLSQQTTYYLSVYALNGDGLSSSSSTFVTTMTTSLVAMPQGFAGSALGVSSITWSWSNVSNESGYRVESSTGGNLSGTLAVDATSWTEINLATNTLLTRQSVAFNVVSTSVSVASGVYTLAAAPTGFAVAQVWNSSLTVSWGANTNPLGTTYYASIVTAGGSTATFLSTNTIYTHVGLSSLTTYYLGLWAINGDGLAAESRVTLATVTTGSQGAAGSISPEESKVFEFLAPPGTMRLEIPPYCFSSSVQVTFAEARSFPAAASSANELSGAGVGVEITVDIAQQPAREVVLTMSYRDLDVIGLEESRLIIARYDTNRDRWVPLVSTVNLTDNTVIAQVNHFSTFQLMQATPASSFDQVKVFPNPFRPSQGHQSITLANLPGQSNIKIYDLTGQLMKELTASSAGLASWNGLTQNGEMAASGVYFAYCQSENLHRTFKFVIQR